MDENYRSLLHVYTAGGNLKTDKIRTSINLLSTSHKKFMVKSLKSMIVELEKQIKEEGK